jgi:predicted nuclease of restriction endonuclease-like (RecB) superfamily
MKRKTKQASKASPVYERIRQILESARTTVARSVNTTQVVANWLIGREIVEEEQKGKKHAGYGEELIAKLARQFRADGIPGYSDQNLRYLRQFYQVYPELTPCAEICHAVRGKFSRATGISDALREKSEMTPARGDRPILHPVRGESGREISHALRAELNAGTISDALSRKTVAGDAPAMIGYAVRSQSATISKNMAGRIGHALRDQFSEAGEISEMVRRKSEITPIKGKQPNQLAVRVESSVAVTLPEIGHALRGESWQPGQLHPNLSWTHYRTLLRVDTSDARAFYEIKAIKNNWSARELERQINSLLYERLALSRDKNGLMKLATKGHEVQQPADVFKDPVVMEFLGLPESPKLVESTLEEALIGNLQAFLMEMGKGFAFVARQERLTLDGDHFYIDLVF